MEGEGERDLKALPYVIAWFGRVEEAVAEDDDRESYNVNRSAIICKDHANIDCACFSYGQRG